MKILLAFVLMCLPLLASGNEVYYPQAAQPGSPPCVAPRVCLWVDSANGQLMIRDATAVSEKVRAARSFRTSANCAALAAPANGDVCYDTGLSVFRLYSGGWTTPSVDDSLLVHKAGTETVTGAKTFSSAITMVGVKITGLAQATASGDAVHGGRIISTTSPLQINGGTSANLTADRALSFVAGGLVYAHISGGAAGALGAATIYLPPPYSAGSVTEHPLGLVSRSGFARNLYCWIGTAPGGADTVIVTARIAGADSPITCTITGPSIDCNDVVNVSSVTAGWRLGLKAVSSAGTAADLTCSFEVTY